MRHNTSIIILSYNTLDLLQLCIGSIREFTEEGTYEIIVVENASQDGSAEWLKEQKDLICIYNEENRGFPKGCNQGLEIAAGTELLLLNSDTIVTKHWLDNLRRALYSSPQVGAVSCVTNYCSNNQQIKVSYESIEEMQAFAAGYNKANPALWEDRTTLVGFCYLFKREVYEKVGFLDERFSPGNYEDDDYSLRILREGYSLLLCRDTFIHHFGSAGFRKRYTEQEEAEKAKRYNALLQRNYALFQKKWQVPENYKAMKAEDLRGYLQPIDAAVEEQAGVLPLVNEKKIAVLVRKSHEAQYAVCMESLQAMKWPAGYEVEVFALEAEKPYAAEANAVLAKTDAKYKIYINDDLCLVSPQAVEELLDIFRDETVGMVGFLGSRSLPVSGNLLESAYKWGAVYVPMENDLTETRFGEATEGESAAVRFLAPSFFATQADLSWNEAYGKQYYAVLAHCQAFEGEGRRIVVPLPQNVWCAYQIKNISFDADEADREIFFAGHHPYLGNAVSDKSRNTLYACGRESEVEGWQEFSYPEGIAIGGKAHIHKTAICRLAFPNFEGEPRIRIGDMCEIDAYSSLSAAYRIVLENFVTLAENVHIADYRYEEENLGLAQQDREVLWEARGVHIGRAASIGANVSIEGAVHIGRGSTIRAGSVVRSDIPAYCIAEGNPARVVKVFSLRAGKWLPAADERELEKVLEERKNTEPLLTVALITYNRSKYLKKSLKCVLQQLGNDELAEILVSDNVSTDDTRKIVQEMQKKYKNLRYHCNEKNVGAEGNIHRAIKASKGEYVLVAGDDDYYLDGSLNALLDGIVQCRGVALLYLGHWNGLRKIYKDTGYLAYIDFVSYFMAWITGVVMRRDLYGSIADPEKYNYTRIPQVYLQLEILKKKPEFAVLHGPLIAKGSGDHRPSGYNFAEVFIKNYFDILTATVKIPPAQLSQEKKRVMEHSVYPWCRKIKEWRLGLSLDGLFDIVKEYYGNEPYYPEVVATLKGILQEDGRKG